MMKQVVRLPLHATGRRLRAARLTFALLGAALALAGCQPAPHAAIRPEYSPPEWTRNAVIYEVNVRQYTPEGTFRALTAHLPRLDSLGVDILWLRPVQPIGVENRKGGLGSYYSIRNYTAVNPEFGTLADMRRFVDSAHRFGMRVILDWVGNHTAFDHPWITRTPDWYTKREDGTISYPRNSDGSETDWTDVAELNFDSQDMRAAMIREMRWWVENVRIDGFRADVAWGVPMDFWREARRELSSVNPDLFMLAEAEGPEYHAVFDATYGWELHHMLNEIAKGEKPVSELDDYFLRQRRNYPPDAYRMYFTSNHDENSWQGSEFERMGANHKPAFILSATAQNSIPLLYTGQEASLSKRLRFFEKDTVDWTGESLLEFYRSVFDLKRSNPALRNGAEGGQQLRILVSGSDSVYAFTRKKGDNAVIVAVNFGTEPVEVTLRGLTRIGQYTDWFSQQQVQLGSIARLDIPGNGYRVLVR